VVIDALDLLSNTLSGTEIAMKKPSKKERSNRRKAKLGAKRRKQRARAGH
jgi:hypothetical protein